MDLKVAVLPCRASISSVHGPFFSYGRLAFLKFVNWWAWLSYVYTCIAEITWVSSFEPSNAGEQKLWYVLQTENDLEKVTWP